ncbi:MAG TPA: DNA polymerase/3'-5' exonuclease PolX [Armatimonadota bacterium]|jgi:DNA polymerase (family 10)
MNNKQIAETLERIADLLEILGESAFRANAYRNAARRIESLTEDAADIHARGELRGIAGIGESLAETISELISAGRSDVLDELTSQVPPGLLDLLNVPGLGPKRARTIHQALGVATLAELEKAARSGRLEDVPGFGKKTADSIVANLGRMKKWAARRLLVDALPVVDDILAALRSEPGIDRAEIGGSVRRWRDTVGDLDLVATGPDLSAILDAFTRLPQVEKVEAHGEKKAVALLESNLPCDLMVVPPESFGAALLTATGSEAHSIRLRELAKARGWLLNQYGVYDAAGVALGGRSEEDMYAALGMAFVPPEMREDRGEVQAALEGRLPALVSADDLKGDLHMHSTYSDGAASIEAMARACMHRGYAYMAITDHSQGLGVANGLKVDRLVKQAEEVRQLNSELAPFRILHGTEVNIRADGTLDYDDETLAMLDWVVASVHGSFGRSREEQTARVIRAIESPYVNLVAHPTGRILNRREGIDVDMDEIIRAAARTGTALEINSGPDRLDLNDIQARSARLAGAWICVDSDAHHPDHLTWVDLGITVARRAWCESRNILNAQPLEALLEFVSRKRASA